MNKKQEGLVQTWITDTFVAVTLPISVLWDHPL